MRLSLSLAAGLALLHLCQPVIAIPEIVPDSTTGQRTNLEVEHGNSTGEIFLNGTINFHHREDDNSRIDPATISTDNEDTTGWEYDDNSVISKAVADQTQRWGVPDMSAMNHWLNTTITNDTFDVGTSEGHAFAYCKVPFKLRDFFRNIWGTNKILQRCILLNRTLCVMAADRGIFQIQDQSEVPASIDKEVWDLYLLTMRAQMFKLCLRTNYPGATSGAIGGEQRKQSWI